MSASKLATFFAFYKKNRSRRLFGFFNDLATRAMNVRLIRALVRRPSTLRCLIVGCAHWANPRDLKKFLTQYNPRLRVAVVALDVLPQALEEAVQHGVDFLPIVTPAQATPFLDHYFDLLVADGLLNCCDFDQHEAIVREMHRISRPGALVLLGLAHAAARQVVTSPERAMPAHCRPLREFKHLFTDAGFSFPRASSVETDFGRDSDVKIENCIARRRAGRGVAK
ncbi:MAG TPA: class I SAM-dependent methyltransferase [Thermoanaerobaculia bacterium]|nr:class I SAM-dependent methyltransferase [Thermoanaerobaculia bacterium]